MKIDQATQLSLGRKDKEIAVGPKLLGSVKSGPNISSKGLNISKPVGLQRARSSVGSRPVVTQTPLGLDREIAVGPKLLDRPKLVGSVTLSPCIKGLGISGLNLGPSSGHATSVLVQMVLELTKLL